MFGTIGSFLKVAALGFAEILGDAFGSPRPIPATPARVAPGARGSSESGEAPPDVSASALGGLFTQAPKPPAPAAAPNAAPDLIEVAASREADVSSPALEAAPNAMEAAASSEADPAAAPGSPVARRYRTLKAEGLTPKQANEFSRSARKYAQFRTLCATRPHAGTETCWDKLKDFDQKTAAHAEGLKAAGAAKPEIAHFKAQAERARDLLIRKYVGGKDALADADAGFVRDFGEGIGFGEF